MNLIYSIDHISKEITVNHPVDSAFEDCRYNISPVSSFRSGERPQIGKQSETAGPVRSDRLILIDESQNLWSGYSIILRCPITPPIGSLYGGTEAFAFEGCLSLPDLLLVVEEL